MSFRRVVGMLAGIAIAFSTFSCAAGPAAAAGSGTPLYAEIATAPARSRLVAPSDPAVVYMGRVDLSDPAQARFDWPATSFSVGFTGGAIYARLADTGENDFAVWIDGMLSARVRAARGENLYPLASGLPEGRHVVRVAKRTEAYQGITAFTGFLIAEGAEAFRPAEPARKILVLGDSLTAGYGVDAPAPDLFWHRDHANADGSWAALLARRLEAGLTAIAASGKGVIRNWGAPGTSSPDPLPPFAWRTLFAEGKEVAGELSDLVIIALGHNDYSIPPMPSYAEFRDGFFTLVASVRSRQPAAPIIVANLGWGDLPAYSRRIVEELVAAGDPSIEYFRFPDIPPDENGCNGHPNAKGQLRLADALYPTVAKLMAWERAEE